MARAALASLGLLAMACGGKEKQSTAMRDTSQVMPSTDTSTAARPESTAAVPADTGHKTPGVKDSTQAPPEAGTSVVRRSDTAKKAKSDTAGKTAMAPNKTATVPKKKTVAAKPTQQPAQDTGTKQAAQDTGTKKAAQDTTTQTAEAPLRDAYHTAPLDTVPQPVYEGWKQFNLNCARCHGEDVLGTSIAPHLIMSLKPNGPINTKELFMSTVCAGRPQKGMPAWCSLGLGMDKIEQIYLYVKGRSDAKIHPGRPAVRQSG
jgi:hypothetical protein